MSGRKHACRAHVRVQVLGNRKSVVSERFPAHGPVFVDLRIPVTTVVVRPHIEATFEVSRDGKPAAPVEAGGMRKEHDRQRTGFAVGELVERKLHAVG